MGVAVSVCGFAYHNNYQKEEFLANKRETYCQFIYFVSPCLILDPAQMPLGINNKINWDRVCTIRPKGSLKQINAWTLEDQCKNRYRKRKGNSWTNMFVLLWYMGRPLAKTRCIPTGYENKVWIRPKINDKSMQTSCLKTNVANDGTRCSNKIDIRRDPEIQSVK